MANKCLQDPGLPRANPTKSRWQDPPHPTLSAKQSPRLQENVDVLIIGSGITGASLAHHLLTLDHNVTILIAEARTITSGATGRNGGQILALPYEGYRESVEMLGLEATKALIEFRGGHLSEIVGITKTVLSPEAAKESEIRVVETIDAVFDDQQWIETKDQLASYLGDHPEKKGVWRSWEKDEAREVSWLPTTAESRIHC